MVSSLRCLVCVVFYLTRLSEEKMVWGPYREFLRDSPIDTGNQDDAVPGHPFFFQVI
jgi:hypothetical protein